MYNIIVGKSTKDAPPKIIQTDPAEPDDPTSYVQSAKTDNNKENKLTCVAENADGIVWKYKKDINDADYSDLPPVMTQPVMEDTGLRSTRFVTDENASRDDRHLVNGYYQCIARSNFVGNEYLAVTPYIRILYPGKAGS